ncbi:Variant-specific surface protein, partial [Giardia duodenalis]
VLGDSAWWTLLLTLAAASAPVLCGALPARGGCYGICVASESGVCREARDGACVGYAEGVTDRTKEPMGVREAQPGCTASGSSTDHCANSKCDVTIGGKTYCSQCATGYVPIDGTCVEESGQDTKCTTNSQGACTQCGDGYFLHRGGCYLQTATPGSTICTKQTAAGICQTCSETNGYFKNPEAAATVDSCISCGDATGVAIGNSNTKTYKGVDGCAKCTAPNSISGDTGTAAATCTECITDLYLKTEASDTSCVSAEDCNTGYFPNDNAGGKKKCLPCSDNSNGGIADCGECSLLPSASRSSTPLVTCTKCSTNNLSPLKNECMASCPAGTYDDNSICKPCHVSCAECNSNANQDSCTACYPGSVLSKSDSLNTGTCIPECTGRYAENCEAGMCTAVLGGSKYCSKCKSGFVPVDGLCVPAGTRAPPTGCTPGDGVCSSCTGTYFLQSGGCYNTKALPGSAVCTQAGSNGQCQTCANGQQYTSGNCPACAEGCSACNAGQTQQCTKCLAGYYLDSTASKCVKCSKDSTDGTIKGVSNCVSCKEPSSGPGPVTCYVTQEPTVDPTDFSRAYLHRELRRQFTLVNRAMRGGYFWPSTSGTNAANLSSSSGVQVK